MKANESASCSVMSHSCDPITHQVPFCPWKSPDKNTGVGNHSLLQGSICNIYWGISFASSWKSSKCDGLMHAYRNWFYYQDTHKINHVLIFIINQFLLLSIIQLYHNLLISINKFIHLLMNLWFLKKPIIMGKATMTMPIQVFLWISSVKFSCSVVSNSLQNHGLQKARPPCPSPTPGVYLNSCPSSRWGHPTMSSPLLPPSIFPSTRVFSNESVFRIR